MRYFIGLLYCLSIILAVDAQNQYPYAPAYTACPTDLAVRPASSGLSSDEYKWRQERFQNVIKSLKTYLPRANITGFDVDKYIDKLNNESLPIIGMATSGGGTQSGMGGLGLWQAFDERYPPAVAAGTGGLAQCMTYFTGLSGGGLLTVAALASNNFSSIAELRNNSDLKTNYVTGPGNNVTAYFEGLYTNAGVKAAFGFPVSVTDVFGQFFRQYLPKSWAYRDYSSIATNTSHAFGMGLSPMPIVALAEVVPGQSPSMGNIMYPGLNSSNLSSYEVTPFEFGSWLGGRVQAFMPTHWLGTMMSQGKPLNTSNCVTGFDKMTFIQGSTGNAFNFYLLDAFFGYAAFAKRDLQKQTLEPRQQANDSIVVPPGQESNPNVQLVEGFSGPPFNQSINESLWATYPNPFMNYNKAMANVDELLIVDGSETGETIPIRPLIVPQRNVDFIIAFDATSDGDNSWVNGTNLLDTAATAAQLGVPFPRIPPAATMVNLGLTEKATFFGCSNASVPLVLYIPNAPWSAYSNFSFQQSEFTDNQIDVILQNALDMVTFGANNGRNSSASTDPPFATCIACAAIDRSLRHLNMTIPDVCNKCYTQHCWNGTIAQTPANPTYNPRLILNSTGPTFDEWNKTVWYKGL